MNNERSEKMSGAKKKTSRKVLCLVSLMLVAAATFWLISQNSHRATQQTSDQLSLLDSATYNISYLEKSADNSSEVTKVVNFADGKYYFPDSRGYAYVEKATLADLNGDGIDEGIALVASNYGGTLEFSELVVLSKQPNGYVEAANIDNPKSFFEGNIMVQSLAVQNGIITVDIFGHGPQDADCCATQPMEQKFIFENDKITEANTIT
ncbi:MAG TPA: hypothetical protein VMQ44_02355 [Candidatus Saccharimonadales bacterium]|nr:hypothetical protein [Candidatus Saccharimonadales bacterium]